MAQGITTSMSNDQKVVFLALVTKSQIMTFSKVKIVLYRDYNCSGIYLPSGGVMMTDLRVMNTMNAICQEDDYPKKREHVAFSTMNDIGSLASCNHRVAYSAHFLRLVLVKTRLVKTQLMFVA